MNEKNIIPIVFATDDNYVPFLAVAIKSIICNASTDYDYKIYVLTTGLNDVSKNNLKNLENINFSIEFIDVNKNLKNIKNKLHLRDYYSKAIYYRVFIPTLFPEYSKAIYLDCDIVVTGDISKLYNHNLQNNLLGAIPEEVMATVKTFGDYSEKALNVNYDKYFNSGILLMNLNKMRGEDIETQFFNLLKRFTFLVAPDQDYLNVICKNRVLYLDKGWNRTPIIDNNFDNKNLNLIHFKMAWKPWQYDDILYGEYFWKYAKLTDFYDYILNIRKNYTEEKIARDKESYEKLIALAIKDINDENNYKNTMSADTKPVSIADYFQNAGIRKIATVE